MDSESTSASHSRYHTEFSLLSNSGDIAGMDDDDPYSWNGTSNALLGLAIAIASIGVPLFVVVLDQPSANDDNISAALGPYGSKSSPSFSISRSLSLLRSVIIVVMIVSISVRSIVTN